MSYISILSRRFILKLAQNPESEKLLKKQLGEFENDPVFAQLIQRGIIPVVAARPDPARYYPPNTDMEDPKNKIQTSQLGQGAYSQVYEVLYKGKLAIAKITQTKPDFDIMLALDKLRPKLGEDAKHLPIIFDHFILPETSFSRKKYVLIVEKCNPINSHLKAVFFPQLGGNNNANFNIAKNNINKDLPAITEKIINMIKNNIIPFNKIDVKLRPKLLELIVDIFKKSILSSKGENEFNRKFRASLQAMLMIFKNEKSYYEILSVIQLLPAYIEDAIGHKYVFPTFSDDAGQDDLNHFKESPEAKDFMGFLLRLRSDFGISWADLHSKNFMIRPSTGDLVLTDSGLFEGVL